jgi:hypothetical protein
MADDMKVGWSFAESHKFLTFVFHIPREVEGEENYANK